MSENIKPDPECERKPEAARLSVNYQEHQYNVTVWDAFTAMYRSILYIISVQSCSEAL